MRTHCTISDIAGQIATIVQHPVTLYRQGLTGPWALCRLLAILVLTPHLSASQDLQPDPISTQRIDSTVQYVMSEWEVPGIAVGIFANDSIALSRGYGVKTLGEPGRVDGQTLFAIASLTKAFTTVCLGMLVEDGRLSWDDRVTDHLPGFQMFDPYVTREMRVRDLLSHRSGLHTFGGDLIWYGTTYGRDEVIRRIRHLKPRYGFREKYGYQNIMFLAAGEIIPRVTGVSWDVFVRDSVLRPLGMHRTNTSVRYFGDDENVATPHVEYEGSILTVPYRNVDNVGPAASLNSSVEDLLHWIAMWLRDESDGGMRLLGEDALREIWTLHTPRPFGPLGKRQIPTQHFYGAALGWFVFDYHGRKILRHGGGMDGMLSQIVLVPEDGIGFVFLSNSGHTPTMPLTFALLDACLGLEENDWLEEPRNWRRASKVREREARIGRAGATSGSEIPHKQLDDYGGVYRSVMYGDVEIDIEEDSLVVRFLPTPSFIGDLRHLHHDTFIVRLRDPVLPEGWITFVRDKHGRVSEMKVVIPNPDFDFTELELHRVGEGG